MPVTVSVVIPTYNRSVMICRALRSVLVQTFRDFEIVVVDDASTDDTAAAINREFQDTRIRYLKLSTNVGAGEARNHGVRAAAGTFIAFLDSDDEWLPEKLDIQLQAIAAASGPVVCYSKYLFDCDSGPRFRPARGMRRGEDLGEYLFCRAGVVHMSSILVTRAACGTSPFPKDLGEDTEFVIDLANKGAEFIYADQALSVYHAEQRTDRFSLSWSTEDLFALRHRLARKMTRRASLGFAATIIAPNLLATGRPLDRRRAGAIIAKALILGGLSPRGAFNLLALYVLPSRLHAAAQRWKARRSGVGVVQAALAARPTAGP